MKIFLQYLCLNQHLEYRCMLLEYEIFTKGDEDGCGLFCFCFLASESQIFNNVWIWLICICVFCSHSQLNSFLYHERGIFSLSPRFSQTAVMQKWWKMHTNLKLPNYSEVNGAVLVFNIKNIFSAALFTWVKKMFKSSPFKCLQCANVRYML